MHCDTILKLMENNATNLRENCFSVDMEKLKRGNYKAQFFALFVELKEEVDPFEECMAMVNRFYSEINNCRDVIAFAGDYNGFKKNGKDDKVSAFLSIEEGGVLKGKLNNLKKFYELGVRLITLTWNYPNEIGYPNYNFTYAEEGLTAFGRELVEEMNRLHMLIDVSHLSDAGFYEVQKISKEPFVASHSNARSITGHSRNLTDDMIKLLANSGGVMGINFCSPFLGKSKKSLVEDMIKHIAHIRNIGGIDVIALGSDFDGIGNEVEIKDCSEMEKLAFGLNRNGFTDDEIEKIFYKNAERIIRVVLN
jgi:membrane dipeptidase